MYEKVLVTLDGSELAEVVLPWTSQVACTAGTKEVVLLTVIEGDRERQRRLAEGYLRDQAAQLEAACEERGGTPPTMRGSTVLSESIGVASTILRFVEENSIDLIMISTHGRSGIDRWLMGSVAEKVLRGADVPLFLVCATDDCRARSISLNRILVPLDGSELAEKALLYAEHLTKCSSGQITLLYVKPLQGAATGVGEREAPLATPPRVESTPAQNKDDREISALRIHRGQDMTTYLGSIADGLGGASIEVETKIEAGHPDQQIIALAEQGSMDLIVMSTHGRTGLNRWAFGSVADRVLHGAPVPILLVPAAVEDVVPQRLRGPLVHCCHNCGRRTYLENFTPKDRCLRCHHHLVTCGNCFHFDGIKCILQLPYEAVHASNRCPRFQFRKTRLALR